MKKTGKLLFVSILVFGLLTLSFGKVFAISSSTDLADPMAKPSFTGETYTTAVVAPNKLPGMVDTGSMFFPLGFTSGLAQVSGNGLTVSGLKPGETVNLSFDFKFYNYDWSGSIYMWTGTMWKKLPTTVTKPGPDGGTTWASVSGVGNGTYALIIFNYGNPTPEDL
jgi:hypothetical protein